MLRGMNTLAQKMIRQRHRDRFFLVLSIVVGVAVVLFLILDHTHQCASGIVNWADYLNCP
jgi:hypothetical protein